jgi:hypothetical protein
MGRYTPNELQPKHFAHLAHGRSLCWHPVPPLVTDVLSGGSRTYQAGKLKPSTTGALKDMITSGRQVTYGTAGVNTPSHFMSACELTYAAATLSVALSLRNELTVLAALSKTRLPQMADVPTIAEAGMTHI